MNLENDFVPNEQTIEMKNLGFNGPYVGWCWNLFDGWPEDEGAKWVLEDRYNNDSRRHERAITYSQAFRWFRKKGYDIKVEKESDNLYFGFYWTGVAWVIVGRGTYEEAELACLKKLIEIVKNK
jgi:hypothetical protein